jgi:Ca2+-binding EF-hand superfamily protein
MKTRLLHLPVRQVMPGYRVATRFLILLSALACSLLPAQEPGDPAPDTAGLDLETLREFERLDQDNDRSLSPAEFASGELAGKAGEVSPSAVAAAFHSIDLDNSGSIELRELLRSQLHRNLRLIEPGSLRNYMSLDRDFDGLISEEEYMTRDKADPAIFRRIDLNGSGRVGPIEWLHALAREPERKETLRRFALLDTDDSGSLDPGEYGQASGEFETLDANGNGLLSPGEFARAASGNRTGELDAADRELFQKLDRNKDQVLSPREFGSHERFKGGRFEEAMKRRIFTQLDANGDGELDSREFANRREAFRGGPPGGKARIPKGAPGGGKAGR